MPDTPPFGKPFAYTDAYDLKTQLDRAKPWYRRWFARRPKAWQLVGVDKPSLPVAHIMHDKQDVVQSEIVAPGVWPIYNERRAILDADEFEREHPEKGKQ